MVPESTLLPALPRCREMLRNSPTALRVLKSALNAAEDGQAGIQVCRGAHIEVEGPNIQLPVNQKRLCCLLGRRRKCEGAYQHSLSLIYGMLA